MSMIRQGDIYDFDFGPQRDNRQEGLRPAAVIQTDLLNQVSGYSLTILVPLSRSGRQSPSHVRIEPSEENGLTDLSFAKCEQIFTVPKSQLRAKRGSLSAQGLYSLKEALRNVLAI